MLLYCMKTRAAEPDSHSSSPAVIKASSTAADVPASSRSRDRFVASLQLMTYC